MASAAFADLAVSLDEIRALQRANPTPTGSAPSLPATTRAVGRSSVVLLTAHFDRYLRRVHEEAVGAIVASAVTADSVPERLRLEHSRVTLQEIVEVSWERRGPRLQALAVEAELWQPGGSVVGLQHEKTLQWMSSPGSDFVIRLFQLWEIDDIFGAITRKATTRSHFWLRLSELVDKRHSIAHGDYATEATQSEVKTYLGAVETFCQRADGVLARQLKRAFGIALPW